MNKIPKCKTKAIILPQQPHYLKVNKIDIINDTNIKKTIIIIIFNLIKELINQI